MKNIDDCGLSKRTVNCLHAADIITVADLCRWTRSGLIRLRNFGKHSMAEISDFIEKNGLRLGVTHDIEEVGLKGKDFIHVMGDFITEHYDAGMADEMFTAIADIATGNGTHSSDNQKVFVTLSEVVARFLVMNYEHAMQQGKKANVSPMDMAEMFEKQVKVFCLMRRLKDDPEP